MVDLGMLESLDEESLKDIRAARPVIVTGATNRASRELAARLNARDYLVKPVDLKFEVVVIPVADADRSKQFYSSLGWRLDADFSFDNGFRVVQFTPPGSALSVQFGTKMTTAPPGSARGLYLVQWIKAVRP